jgi:hypothetical protein
MYKNNIQSLNPHLIHDRGVHRDICLHPLQLVALVTGQLPQNGHVATFRFEYDAQRANSGAVHVVEEL